jgi:hypothetical protein
MDQQLEQFLTVPLLMRVLPVDWSQMPMPLQLVAFIVLMVQYRLPETLKNPRPQLVELTVPTVVLRLLFATRNPA